MAAKGLPIQKQMAVINDAWFAGKYNLKQPSEAAVLKVVRHRKSLRAAGDFKQLARETCQMFGTWPKMASIVSEMERQNFKIHQKAMRLTKKRNLYRIKKEMLTVNPSTCRTASASSSCSIERSILLWKLILIPSRTWQVTWMDCLSEARL